MSEAIRNDEVKKPKRCPYCNFKHIDTGLMPDSDELDVEFAFYCTGEQPASWADRSDKFLPFWFGQENAVCDNCNTRWSYGQRWYYDAKTNSYSITRDELCLRYPNTQESIAAAREQQIAAGQLELPINEVTP